MYSHGTHVNAQLLHTGMKRNNKVIKIYAPWSSAAADNTPTRGIRSATSTIVIKAQPTVLSSFDFLHLLWAGDKPGTMQRKDGAPAQQREGYTVTSPGTHNSCTGRSRQALELSKPHPVQRAVSQQLRPMGLSWCLRLFTLFFWTCFTL